MGAEPNHLAVLMPVILPVVSGHIEQASLECARHLTLPPCSLNGAEPGFRGSRTGMISGNLGNRSLGLPTDHYSSGQYCAWSLGTAWSALPELYCNTVTKRKYEESLTVMPKDL